MYKPLLNRFLICGLLLTSLQALGAPPMGQGFIGLLEIRPLHSVEGESTSTARKLVLRSAPNVTSEQVGLLSNASMLETFEWSYESPAAAVYGYHRDPEHSWYRLRQIQPPRDVWLMQSSAMTFHALSSLLSDSLSYFTTEWDGRLFRRAGVAGTASSLRNIHSETPIAVAAHTLVGTKDWFLVVVLDESPCESAAAPAVRAAGWVPAHSSTRRLNMWFYSRGC